MCRTVTRLATLHLMRKKGCTQRMRRFSWKGPRSDYPRIRVDIANRLRGGADRASHVLTSP